MARMAVRAFPMSAPRVPPRAAFAVAALAVAALAGGVVALAGMSLEAAMLVASGAILAVPFLRALHLRTFDPFEPIFVAVAAHGTMFVIRPASELIRGDLVYVRPTRIIDISGTMDTVIGLGLAASAAMVVGYYLPVGPRVARRLRPPTARLHSDSLLAGALLTALMGMMLFGLFLMTSGGTAAIRSFLAGRDISQVGLFRQSTGYLYYGPFLLIPAALLAAAASRARRDLGILAVAAAIAAMLLVIAVPTGNRIFILPLAGSLATYFYVSRGRRPAAAAVVVVAIGALLASHALLLARDARGDGLNAAIVTTLTHPLESLDPITTQADAEMAPALAGVIAVDSVNPASTHGFATIGDTFVRPLPRLLWSEKPLAARHQVIEKTWPIEYKGGYANPEFSILLYFYLDASYIGVVLGMLLVGILLRLLYASFLLHGQSEVMQLAFSALLPFIPILLRDSPTDTVVKLAFSVVPLAGVCWLATDRRRAAAPGTEGGWTPTTR